MKRLKRPVIIMMTFVLFNLFSLTPLALAAEQVDTNSSYSNLISFIRYNQFDHKTMKAVKDFQADHQLKTTGVVNNKTVNALDLDSVIKEPSFQKGDHGIGIYFIKQKLFHLGYYTPNDESKNYSDKRAKKIVHEYMKWQKTQKEQKEQKAQKAHDSSAKQDSSQTIQVTATAYTAKCDGCSGVTKTGVNLMKHPKRKVIAVDPDIIPLGTKVYIPGYGYATAADTGGAIDGHRIDIYFPSKDKAFKWGVKHIDIKILS